jgi:hypothetical protein
MSGFGHALVWLTHGPQTFEHEHEHEHDFRTHSLTRQAAEYGQDCGGIFPVRQVAGIEKMQRNFSG